MINVDTIFQRQDNDLLSSSLADETVMMNVQTGDYLSLNSVSTEIWNLLENPITIKNICEDLLSKYDVDESTCQSQTVSFIQELLDKNLVKAQ